MGFFAKQFVLYSAIQSGYYFISIVGIIASVISASYYLKIIRVLHSTPTATSDLFAIDNARALIQGQENINRTKGSTGEALGSEKFNQTNKSNNYKFGT